jgi:hypothetical protein
MYLYTFLSRCHQFWFVRINPIMLEIKDTTDTTTYVCFYINEQVKSYLVQQEINDYSKQAVVT